jgi:hypothetical protein
MPPPIEGSVEDAPMKETHYLLFFSSNRSHSHSVISFFVHARLILLR